MRRGKKYAVILRFVTVGCTLGDFVVKISRHNTQTCDGTAADEHEGEGLMRDHVKTLQRLKKLRGTVLADAENVAPKGNKLDRNKLDPYKSANHRLQDCLAELNKMCRRRGKAPLSEEAEAWRLLEASVFVPDSRAPLTGVNVLRTISKGNSSKSGGRKVVKHNASSLCALPTLVKALQDLDAAKWGDIKLSAKESETIAQLRGHLKTHIAAERKRDTLGRRRQQEKLAQLAARVGVGNISDTQQVPGPAASLASISAASAVPAAAADAAAADAVATDAAAADAATANADGTDAALCISAMLRAHWQCAV
jgi:hypothetical protein